MLLRTVDCRDVMAPWSTVRAVRAMASAPFGGYVQVSSIDPTDLGDLRAWCHRTGEVLVSAHSCFGVYEIVMRKMSTPPAARDGAFARPASADLSPARSPTSGGAQRWRDPHV
jgi:TusA-related sulfurtransferase